MLLHSKQVKGKQRGHALGFPTINLALPTDLALDDGIYAAWIVIRDKTYKGALHYGAIPTFNERDKTMEVNLIDVTDETVPDTSDVEIEVDIVEKIRDVKKFINNDELVIGIARDIEKVRMILK